MNTFTQNKVFSKDNIALETETDVLVRKMERIQNKRNNYKNIEILENIYDKPVKHPIEKNKKNKTILQGITDFFENVGNIGNKLDKIKKDIYTLEGFDDADEEGFDDADEEGFDDDDEEGFDDDDEEGFDDADEEGFDDADEEGFDDADEEGFDDADEEGFDDADEEGFDDDDEEGFDDDDEEGFDDDDEEGFDVVEGLKKKSARGKSARGKSARGKSRRTKKRRSKKRRSKKRRSKKRKTKRKRSKKRKSRKRKSRRTTSGKTYSNNKADDIILSFLKKLWIFIITFSPPKYINNYISQPLYNITSANQNKNNADVQLITNQFIFFIYACISVLISSNWYFIMFNRENGFPNSDKFNARLDSIGDKIGFFYRTLKLENQFMPVWLLNTYLCDIIRYIMVFLYGYIKPSAYYLFSFLGFVIGKQQYDKISNSLLSIVENIKLLFVVFTFIVFYYIIKYSGPLYREFMIYKNPKLKLPEYSNKLLRNIILINMFIGIKGLVDSVMSIIGMPQTSSSFISKIINTIKLLLNIIFGGIIFSIIMFFIALAVNMMIIRFSGLVCIFYLYIYSFFGAELRGGKSSISNFYKKMEQDDPCKTIESNLFIKIIHFIISYLFDNLTLVIIIICSIWSIRIFKTKMFNKQSAFNLTNLNLMIIIIAIIYSIYNSTSKKLAASDYNYIEPYNQQ